jgi:hypothetical protein
MARCFALVVAVGLAAPGCGLVGPSCLARQHRGAVTALSGEVAPRAVTVHRVAYGSEGSQNDLEISWDGQRVANGPRIRVYATKVDCVDFVPERGAGPCASIGSGGGFAEPGTGQFVQTSLIVTNGRGNPDILGSPPEYKLWVVGDADRTSRYAITITWFYGPDC